MMIAHLAQGVVLCYSEIGYTNQEMNAISFVFFSESYQKLDCEY